MNKWITTPPAIVLLVSLGCSLLLTLLANTALDSHLSRVPICVLPILVPVAWWTRRKR